MTVTPSFRSFVLDQLARAVPGIRARSMFGGVGVYDGELFFALMDEDTLYFKVDDENRAAFERAGMGPFRPGGMEGEVMQYYEVPADALDDPEELGRWAAGAIGAAQRARARKTRRRHVD
jgi:DNA transformation protein and related proteins